MTTIGLLYPGYAAEDDYPFMEGLFNEDIELRVIHTSVGEDAHEVQALLDLGSSQRLLQGAGEMRELPVDSVMWACTSASFVFGWEGAKAQAEEIGAALGVPASSTSLAFVEALRHIGARKVAIAATYPREVSAHFRTFLEAGGVEVVSMVSHDIATAALASELSDEGVLELARSNDALGADAVLLPDTAMHTARLIGELERTLAKPVLTANQVTVWKGLALAGIEVNAPALGTLFGAKR